MNIETLDWPPAKTIPPDLQETQRFNALNQNPGVAVPQISTKDIFEILRGLIQITRDGEEGYNQAADHVADRSLREEFHKFSRERKSMVSELQTLEKTYGKANVDTDGTLAGTVHRAWMDFVTVIAKRDDQAILDEAERGEDVALHAYRQALKHDPMLPASVRYVVTSLAEKIQRAHDRVRALRDSGLYDREIPIVK